MTASSSEGREAIDAGVAFLTVDQVAARLGMSKWFVYSHGAELGRVKFGGAVRFRADRVEAYLAERLTGDVETPHSAPPAAPPPHRKRETRGGRRRRVPLLETNPSNGPT